MIARSLCILNNIPTPYRRELFDEIAQQADGMGIEFSVLYLAPTETVRNWEIEIRPFESILPVLWRRRNPRTPTSDFIVNLGFISRAIHPDVVILFGYNYLTYLIVACLRGVLRRTTLLFCETTSSDSHARGWRKWIKSFALRILFDRYIVPGRASADYLIASGVEPERIQFARNASSMRPTCRLERSSASSLRVLFVGRLAPEKRILELTRAFSKLDSCHRLTLVGEGPLAIEIQTIIEEHSNIRMLGQVARSDLPNIYSASDVLILPSEREPWGFVVNEAINFGMALILSPQVGAGCELLDGNGVLIGNIAENSLFSALETIAENIDAFRVRSLEISAHTTVVRQAAAFLAATINGQSMKPRTLPQTQEKKVSGQRSNG